MEAFAPAFLSPLPYPLLPRLPPRHTVWHAASTAGLVWLAEVEGRGELLEPLTAHVPKFVESLLP